MLYTPHKDVCYMISNKNLKTEEPQRSFGRSTCTVDIYELQHSLQLSGNELINRNNIAEALAKRNILRQFKTIQMSSNLKFVSIEFDTTSTMETFCLETLTIKENLFTSFLPDYQKPLKKSLAQTS